MLLTCWTGFSSFSLSGPTHHVQDVFLCFLGAWQLHSTRHVLQRQRQEGLQEADETETDIKRHYSERSAGRMSVTSCTLTFLWLNIRWILHHSISSSQELVTKANELTSTLFNCAVSQTWVKYDWFECNYFMIILTIITSRVYVGNGVWLYLSISGDIYTKKH